MVNIFYVQGHDGVASIHLHHLADAFIQSNIHMSHKKIRCAGQNCCQAAPKVPLKHNGHSVHKSKF